LNWSKNEIELSWSNKRISCYSFFCDWLELWER